MMMVVGVFVMLMPYPGGVGRGQKTTENKRQYK